MQRQGTPGLSGTLISVPLYGQVLGVLRQRIFDGFYSTGDQLPPEDRLAAEFGVSRATIRQAVGELVRQSLVDRRQGRGTFVLATAGHMYGQRFSGSLTDFIAETDRSKAVAADVDRKAKIPTQIAQVLRLSEPTGTIVRRTRAIDGRAFAYTVNFIPDRYGRLVSPADLRRSSLMTLLISKGVQFGEAQQVIRAEQADIEVCEHLQLDFAAPVLYAERLVLTTDGDPVQFVRSWYRSDLYEYRVNMHADGGESSLHFRLA